MLGLLALGLTAIMIYTLVKNALVGKQLTTEDTSSSSIELLVPVTEKSRFLLEKWPATLSSNIKVNVLIDGHHPQYNEWQELKSKLSYLEIHNFSMRPAASEAIPWMLEQYLPRVAAEVVIIGDAELVPTEAAFMSIANAVTEKKRSYFVVPQTSKHNVLGEAIAVLNPTLAFASFFGFKKWRRNVSHPLLGVSEGWMAMNLENFKALNFQSFHSWTWKEVISRQWDEQKKTYHLAFGEKQLIRFYPEDLKVLAHEQRAGWDEMFERKEKIGFGLYLVALFLWSFPVVCLLTHPFWALASVMLLILYRFFSKIVFQESWGSIVLHPLACVFWIGTFCWFLSDKVKEKYFNKRHQGTN